MDRNSPPWLKPVVDYVPLAVFFAVFWAKGLISATIALMAATLVAVTVSFLVSRRLALIPLITALVVGVFGGLTLWLNDESFIKMKPTVVYLMFAAILGGGLVAGRSLLKPLLGEAIPLDDAGWRQLSLRFVLFFLAMAMVNEVVRRTLSTDLWVLWKVPGSIALTFVFMLLQAPMLKRHRSPDR